MNVSRWCRSLLLCPFLSTMLFQPYAPAWAQPVPELGLSGAVLALEYSIRDLAFGTRDLAFAIQDVGGTVKALAMKENDTEVRLELAADALFDFDKAEILPRAREALHQVAALIRERKTGRVRIEGHTDAKGSDAYNRSLSERRAKSVLDWLLAKENLKELKAVREEPACGNCRQKGLVVCAQALDPGACRTGHAPRGCTPCPFPPLDQRRPYCVCEQMCA